MSEPRAFPDPLHAWLNDGPELAPPDLLGVVIDEVAATDQARWVWPWRHSQWKSWLESQRRARLIGLLAMVAVIALMTLLTLPPGPRSSVGGPDMTPFVRPSVVPVISPPMASLPFDPCLPSTGLPVPGMRDGFDPAAARGRIAFRSDSEILAVEPADPSRPVVIDPSLVADPVMWSADGSRLLLMGAGTSMPNTVTGTFILGSDGHTTMITDFGLGSLAPDGNTVVYASPGGGLCYAPSDGSPRELLAFDMAEPMDGGPAWSPDGQVIAYLDFVEDSPVYGHHAYGLSYINADGSNLRQLAIKFAIETGGGGLGWSPDGTQLAFWLPSGNARGRAQIFVVDVATDSVRELTTASDDRWPSWSPDGSRIAFVREGVLFTMRPDGSDQQPVGAVRVAGSIAWNGVQGDAR